MPFRAPKCNCPDAINKRGALPGASAVSDQYKSDWSGGFTGVKSIGGYCIHELAVLRVRKELKSAFPDGLPTDFPTPPALKLDSYKLISRLQNPPILGDDFSV